MKDFLLGNGIENFALIPLERCKILKEYLLTKNGFDKNANAITLLIPYRTELAPVNLSVYASVMDYHGFVKDLGDKLDRYARQKHPNAKIKLFSDHSPIDEVHAACISGLGFIGDHGLLINEKYSSFVFLAEIITDLSPEELGMEHALDEGVTECLHCGACAKACPSKCIKRREDVCDFNPKALCLSAVTQKKGELTDSEIAMMLDNNMVWGCDVCQNVCPYTKNAEFSQIEYFKANVITELTKEMLNGMSDEEFLSRPFSWRGKSVVERNLNYFEKKENAE